MKTYNIIDKKTNIPEYIIKSYTNDDGDVYELYYSYNKEWSNHIQGTLTLTMIDDGNHIKFKPLLSKIIDYSDLEKLRILLIFYNNNQSLKSEYLVKEEILITEI